MLNTPEHNIEDALVLLECILRNSYGRRGRGDMAAEIGIVVVEAGAREVLGAPALSLYPSLCASGRSHRTSVLRSSP
jgi:hypothetical protein